MNIQLGMIFKENDKRFTRYVKVCSIYSENDRVTRLELCAGKSPDGPWNGRHTHSTTPERFRDKPRASGYTLVKKSDAKPNPWNKTLIVYSRNAKEVGVAISVSMLPCVVCGQCERLIVRWPDGKITKPCANGVLMFRDGLKLR